MSTLTKTVNNATVFYDSVYVNRWYDAIGPSVAKYLQEFVTWPDDDTTSDPTEFVCTITEAGGGGDSTAAITDAAGGAMLITTDNLENDGYRLQLGHANAGESILMDGDYPVYMGIKFAINDVTDTDFFFGLAVTDADALGGVTDGMYFRMVDADDELFFVAERDGAETAVEVHTLVDAAEVTAEFYFDGGTVYVYIDGVLMTSLRSTAPNFPDDEELRLTLEFLTGEAVANTCTVSWMKMIHLRG